METEIHLRRWEFKNVIGKYLHMYCQHYPNVQTFSQLASNFFYT